jgi:hypothetical protein
MGWFLTEFAGLADLIDSALGLVASGLVALA